MNPKKQLKKLANKARKQIKRSGSHSFHQEIDRAAEKLRKLKKRPKNR